MSLNRFINKESILALRIPQYGQVLSNEDLLLLVNGKYHFDDPNIESKLYPEIHIYSFYGDYLTGNHVGANFIRWDKKSNSLLCDLASVFKSANIVRGSYVVNINLLSPVFGDVTSPPFVLLETSPDRTEAKFKLTPSVISSGEYSTFVSAISAYQSNETLHNVVLNFGYNRLFHISNFKIDKFNPDIFYVKFINPLSDDISDYDTAWFNYECADTYSDTVILVSDTSDGVANTMRGPNFDIDTTYFNSNSTTYKSWDDILDTNLPITQQILDSSVSGSGTATLNIDFSDFSNYVFYSSAYERINNFIYKLSMIEDYENKISILTDSTASNTAHVSQSIGIHQGRINTLKTSFDWFEKWMYYHTTGSIFTHDFSGSMQPYPKYLQNSEYVLHHLTSSIAQTWSSSSLAYAQNYDQGNMNMLVWSIPEHVLMDEESSEYVSFVHMVGQHFDNIYSYVRALTQIHERDEHYERGMSNDLLYHVAKSYGWRLQNVRQLSNIFLYKLGTQSDGKVLNTGSSEYLPHELQTKMVWRRIVNNLPYLYKTKGTIRSVRALLSIYGVPQTLISVKEYGGPSVETDKPTLIEDRYFYSLNLSGSQYVELPRRLINISSGSWGGVSRVPDTVIFRFNTQYSSSVSMSLWAIEDGADRSIVKANLEIVHATASLGISEISGSSAYGFLRFTMATISGSSPVYQQVSSSLLPLYDRDYWTVKIQTTSPITDTYHSQSISFDVGKVIDGLYGRISHTQSFSFTTSNDMRYGWGAESGSVDIPNIILIGGTTGSNSNRFIGKMDGYKEYFEPIDARTFHSHILNPAAYHSNAPTSSYYTLFRYYPFGQDVQRWDHSTYTQVSSSHPNRVASFDTTASFYNFSGSQAAQYSAVKETFYIYTPTLGGNTLHSEKVRLDENRLLRDLTPTGTSVKAKYDYATNDSNRLAIVFSVADQSNRDIFNHMGFSELDYLIADPEDEFSEEYLELTRFSNEYWKKYQQRNDINSLIRLLSLYDYTFFEQVKQLTPAKADLIVGILIEPYIINRSKVRLTRRPTIENPQYEQELSYELSQSGEFPTYDAAFTASMAVQIGYTYYTGSIADPFNLCMLYSYYTGSIADPFTVGCDIISHKNADSRQICGVIEIELNNYSGSTSHTESVIARGSTRSGYQRVIYHYGAFGEYGSQYLKQWHTAISMSYNLYYSRSLEDWGYQYEEDAPENNHRFLGSKMSAPDFNQNSPDTVDGGPIVEIYESNPNSLNVSPWGDSELYVG